METLSPKCKAFIRGKIRLAWRYYSLARKECLKTAFCVGCKRKKCRLYADHIKAIGKFVPEENPFIARIFCTRENLQSLCESCHAEKTKKERVKK